MYLSINLSISITKKTIRCTRKVLIRFSFNISVNQCLVSGLNFVVFYRLSYCSYRLSFIVSKSYLCYTLTISYYSFVFSSYKVTNALFLLSYRLQPISVHIQAFSITNVVNTIASPFEGVVIYTI